MNLIDVTHIINEDNKAGELKLHIHAFHSFNRVILFVKEPTTNFPFMLNCGNSNILGFNMLLRTYKFKPPVEFMDELFYFHKVNYYIKAVKTEALSHLFSKYGLHPELSSNRNKYDYVNVPINIKRQRQKVSAILKYVYTFQKAYSQMLAKPKSYFSIISVNKLDTDELKKLRSQIKSNELNRENILEKEAHRYETKHTSKSKQSSSQKK